MEGFERKLPLEEATDEGRGILVRRKTLFHGSSASGIEKLNPAEETTVGEGVYFTSKREDAEGYANRRSRSREDAVPTIYRANIENLKFFDARSDDNVAKVLKGFLEILQQERQKEGLPWSREAVLDNAIEKIRSSAVTAGNLRDVGFAHGRLFTDYIQSLGYDGLIALEGGEGEDIGNHDTYLIFDPEKVGILLAD